MHVEFAGHLPEESWVRFERCPFQFQDGALAELASLTAQGADGANTLWRWHEESTPAAISIVEEPASLLSGWSVGEWSYASKWPVQEPGDELHWSLGANDPRAFVRRRALCRKRVDLKTKARKEHLRKEQEKEMATFAAQYGLGV